MKRSQELYQQICAAAEREALTDADIDKIVLFLQRRLRQSGDAADLGIRQLVYLDANPL